MPIFNRVTIRDIAARVGVSHVTVSLALKDSTRISKRRRDEVQKLALEMGYRPDPILSSLVVYRQNKRLPQIQSTLAWLNHWKHPEAWRKVKDFNAYWTGASKAAERYGYRLDEFVWQPEFTAQRLETILKTRGVRGVLIPPHPTQPDWGNFHWNDFSVVRFGLSVRSPYSHVVTSDHLRSVVSSIEKIYSYGYERIGFVMPADFDLRMGGNYSGGLIAAQKVLQLSYPLPPLMTQFGVTERVFNQKLKQWLNKCRPDAILTGDVRVVEALKCLGLRIPQDIAVSATSVFDIPLDTGVDQNSEEIGRVAAETLVSLINANEKGIPAFPRRILIEGCWIAGKSMPNRKTSQQSPTRPLARVK